MIARILNTRIRDEIGISFNGSIDINGTSNVFTVPAGTYRVFASAPVYVLNRGCIRLMTTPGGIELVRGQTNYGVTNTMGYFFTLSGVFSLTTSTGLYIEQNTPQATSNDSQALGVSLGISGLNEMYTMVELTKLA